MQTDSDSVPFDGLSIGQGFDARLLANPEMQNPLTVFSAEIRPHAGTGVVGMSVGNDGTVHPLPGVDVEIAVGTIQPTIRHLQQVSHASVLLDFGFERVLESYSGWGEGKLFVCS